jgi:hypothetical protein
MFTASAGQNSIEVRFENEMIWASQKMIAELFETTHNNVSMHLKSLFASNELSEQAVVKDFLITAADGKSYKTKHYHLDAVIAVGYRVNGTRATQFRKWATNILQKYTIQGYVMDKERMKNGAFLGRDYFLQVLADVREIRLSERRFYQKITDIYATSMDYDKDASTTKKFYATVQNKMHYAIHGKTAAEVIVSRADSAKQFMGLSSWEKAPRGKVVKTDVVIAKNYLDAKELKSLEQIVTMYLDYAESQAEREIPMTMQDWNIRLNAFMKFNDRDILEGSGKVSAAIAKSFAESEYEKYRIVQDKIFESDFDKLLSGIETPH